MKNWNLVLKVGLMVLIMGISSYSRGQLFWGGTNAESWTSTSDPRWGTVDGGPYSTTWVSGSAAVFNVPSSTITGATTQFSSITANENVLITPTGTLGTGGTVASITVASGKTLDFNGQGMSTTVGTGFIKYGEGVLAFSGGNYSGGFTLNTGTVIVRSVNAMGSGTVNTLTINGGIIAAIVNKDLSDKYGGGITIGGDFTIGATTGLASSSANLTFNDNTSLGTGTTRSITIGGTGTYLFSGIVSGTNSNLNINATANGTISFTEANTYSGTTTISGGTLNLGRTGGTTIPTSNSIIVNGGTLMIATNQELNNLTIASGASVIVADGATLSINGTIECGASAAIEGDGNFSLSSSATLKTANASGVSGTITVTGTQTFSSGANYEFQGASTGTFTTTPTGNTVNNLTINNSSGDVDLSQSLTVTGALNLTAGKLNLGSNNLTLDGTWSGPAFGTTTLNYVVAEGIGTFRRSSGLFPVGTPVSYMPCEITGGTGPYHVNLQTPIGGLTTNEILKKQWNISNGGGVPSLSFQWPASEENAGFPTPGSINLYRYFSSWAVAGTASFTNNNPRTASFLSVECCSGYTVGSQSALPVELVDFRGNLRQKKVHLTWQTFSEINNDYFSIEKSKDGNNFEELGRLTGKGTSYEVNEYSFLDEEPAPGLNYYRLKQLDFDGSYHYSKTIVVDFAPEGKISLYPNPARDWLQIDFPEKTAEQTTIYLFDAMGRLALTEVMQPGNSSHRLDVRKIFPGNCWIEIQSGRAVETHRFLKI